MTQACSCHGHGSAAAALEQFVTATHRVGAIAQRYPGGLEAMAATGSRQ